ncbi:MAG TPA: hypothetical protein VLA55_03945, partial [Ornithinibacter sp.]|nr:hypothetical protein [Ornithinibacter sp.]
MPRTTNGALTLAEEGPPSPTRRRLGLVVVIALVAVVGVAGYAGFGYLRALTVTEACEVTAAGSTFQWAPDQASNA